MKTTLLKLSLTAAFVAMASTASAQTIWTGSVDSNINEAGNWNPTNLPTSAGNTGTIGASGPSVLINEVPLTGYHVIQDANAVTGSAATRINLFGGNYTINGGTFSVNQLGLQNGTGVVDGNQNFTINGGSVSTATTTTTGLTVGSAATRTATMDVTGGSFSSRNVIIANGGAINVSGGTFDTTVTGTASGLRVNGGGVFTVSGGTVTLASEIRNGGSLIFTGGTTTTTRLRGDDGFSMTLGGTTAGSFTAGDVNGATNFDINWLPGTQMTMTLSTVAIWAETYWADGRMTYNGQDFNALGDWATVTGTGGLGGGANFSYVGNTLSVIPEPTTWALLAVTLTAAVTLRRRRAA